jgi:hypothetical protein
MGDVRIPLLILAAGRGSWLAYDLLRSSSKPVGCGVPDTTEVSGFAAASQQIVGKPTPTAFGQKPDGGEA